MRNGIPIVFVMLSASSMAAPAAEVADLASSRMTVAIDAFPLTGPREKLEPEIFDFRYQPERWQACIGLPDDPYKTIVGSDGGLYYDYGKAGPAAYDNGQGHFGTRVLARLETGASRDAHRQRLHDARTPIVTTEQDYGSLRFSQEAWASAPRENDGTSDWSRRADFYRITVKNMGQARAGTRLLLDVGSYVRLGLDATGTRVAEADRPGRLFCRLSRPCLPPTEEPRRGEADHAMAVRSEFALAVQKNWAMPKGDCAPCFRHVLVARRQPLEFGIPVGAGTKYRVVLGLLEGWHREPGKRPLEIRVEGRSVATIDMVQQYGHNVPAVIEYLVEDQDGDGMARLGVHPVEKAEDHNPVLSGLWVFPAHQGPPAQDVLAGRNLAGVLAVVDADHPPLVPEPLTLAWDAGSLDANGEWTLLVTLPQGDAARLSAAEPDAVAERARAVSFWRGASLPYGRIEVPDKRLQDLLDSSIRNIYQAREIKNGKPVFQVGPTCYRGTWAADGPFILEAVTYLGRADEARAGLESQIDEDSGPGGIGFSKKSGLRLWMILRHVELTGDEDWLQAIWPRVEREVNQITAYRRMTLDDPKQANYGLMPAGMGDGGLGGPHREYTNVYWTLAGLRAAIVMARRLDIPVASAWQAQFDDYWRAMEKARNRDKLKDAHGNLYVPVTMQGEEPQLPQRGAWAFLQSIYPGRIFAPQDELMLGTLAMLDANQREGLIYGTGWIADGIWNYAGSFYAHAHLWLGHDRKAAATLYAFANHACALLCWREEQRPRGDQPRYVGDMPHNWASAEFIRLVRDLLVLERGDELHLLEGLPRAWARPGSSTRLSGIATSFGPVGLSLDVARDGRSARIAIDPPERESVARLVLHLEHLGREIESVRWNGRTRKIPAVVAETSPPLVADIRFK